MQRASLGIITSFQAVGVEGKSVLAKRANNAKRKAPGKAPGTVPNGAKTSRDEQKDATRELLLEAATKLLADSGYAALRVAAVANQAHISLGGLLHHFPTKDSLVVAVLERLSAYVMDMATREAALVSKHDDPLLPISRSAERFYSAPEFLIYLDIFLSVRRHTIIGDTATKLLTSQRSATEEMWVPYLISHGIPSADAFLIVRALWGLSRGLAISSGEHAQQGHQAALDVVIDALRASYFARPLPSRIRRT